MILQLARLGRATASSVGAGLVVQLMLLVSGVLAARVLGVEDRGYLALLVLFPSVFAQLGCLGAPLAVTYFVAREPASAGRFASAALRLGIAQAAASVVVHAAVLAIVLRDDPPYVRAAAVFTLVAIPASLAQQYALAFLQGQKRFRAFNVLRVLPPAIYTFTLVSLFVVDVGSLREVTIAWLAASVIVGVFAVAFAAAGLPAQREPRAAIGPLIRFGTKGLLGSASPVETFRLDQAIVGLALSPAALGVYVVAIAFTNVPRFVANSIGLVAYPSVAAEQSGRRWLSVWRYFLFALLVCGAIVLALEPALGWLVPLFFGAEFADAVSVARIMLLGALFLGLRRVLTDAARGAERVWAGTIAEVAAWVALVPALAALVPLWDVDGVAAAVVVASGVSLGVLVVLLLVQTEVRPPRPPRVAIASSLDLTAADVGGVASPADVQAGSRALRASRFEGLRMPSASREREAPA
jgi:O-antigen/teichoic acid export membrane protein